MIDKEEANKEMILTLRELLCLIAKREKTSVAKLAAELGYPKTLIYAKMYHNRWNVEDLKIFKARFGISIDKLIDTIPYKRKSGVRFKG